MKSPNKFKNQLKRLYSNKMLKGFIKPLPRYGKAINAVVLLAFVMLVVAGVGAALTVHNKPTPITTSPTSSTDGNNCLLSNSGCSDSKSSSTPTPTTQPAQSTTTTTSSNSSSTDCTDNTVPYTTTYQDVTWIQTGQTMNLPGTNGTDRICDGNVTVMTKPFNAIDYIGTGTNLEPSTVTPSQPNTEPYQNTAPSNSSGLTEAQAAQQCDENLANGADASDPQAYLDQCMSQYGY